LEFKDLPESVYADESSLEKVFMNLIGNAVNYIGEGEKEITVRAELLEDHVRLTVEDTGLGIPEDSLPYVFEKFRRGQNVAGIQGTGLGLAIVDGIVRAHGGTVTIESEVGVGTTVSLTLPFAQEREPSQEEQPAGFAETEQGR
ncbi:MAG: sensor histidine kinase, partial [Planctomycetota bacterium]